jgi:stringent starvation protein B
MVHPVQSVIESLYAAGRCPRLHVNASHADVVCPDFIREQWKERLIIDLDASYPLDLTFGDTGLAADLSFGGYVTRCEFPWEAIYIVADRATGRGIVLDRNMPESVRVMFQKARSESAKSKQPDLRPVSAVEEVDAAATGDAPEAARADDATDAAEATDADDAAEAAKPPSAPSTDEKQVQKRRAAFRVIDGGG